MEQLPVVNSKSDKTKGMNDYTSFTEKASLFRENGLMSLKRTTYCGNQYDEKEEKTENTNWTWPSSMSHIVRDLVSELL